MHCHSTSTTLTSDILLLSKCLARYQPWHRNQFSPLTEGFFLATDNMNADIHTRLENWARWATARGRRGADSMTGAVCERMRKAALGNVWSGHEVRDEMDGNDAWAIQRAMGCVTLQQRMLLHWRYIMQARPEVICRMAKIMPRPITIFEDALRSAQTAIEQAVDNGTYTAQNSAQQLISV